MKAGFAEVDITPRLGVELSGFGPFLNRYSTGVRDRLKARAMCVEAAGRRAVVVSCDLIGITQGITDEVRKLVAGAVGVDREAIMIHCTHTHSGPATGSYIGWGEPDAPYLELLPGRIARACVDAVARMQDAVFMHAEVPCEGIGINREYDAEEPSLDMALDEGWRPSKPELTDTTCHVLSVKSDGRMIGFVSYFGCHPVVCGAKTHLIHGDYCGVATNRLEDEYGGAVGLFLQGAEGDVNSCVVCDGEDEGSSMLALDIIAERYARAVRTGIEASEPVPVDGIAYGLRRVGFKCKAWDREKVLSLLKEKEDIIRAPGADETDYEVRMAVVEATALRKILASIDAGTAYEVRTEIQGVRIGPVTLLGAPFEIFQAVKNDIVSRACSDIPLVMSLTNDNIGYAVDRTMASRGGYAASLVPFICGMLPFEDIHGELVEAMLALEADLSV